MLWATCAGSAGLSRLWRRRFGRYLPDAGALSNLSEDVSANMVSHGERSPNRCCLAACGTSESKHSPCFRRRRCRCHHSGRHSLTISDSASLDLRARAMTAARVPPGNDRRPGCEHDAGLLKAVRRRRRSRSRVVRKRRAAGEDEVGVLPGPMSGDERHFLEKPALVRDAGIVATINFLWSVCTQSRASSMLASSSRDAPTPSSTRSWIPCGMRRASVVFSLELRPSIATTRGRWAQSRARPANPAMACDPPRGRRHGDHPRLGSRLRRIEDRPVRGNRDV